MRKIALGKSGLQVPVVAVGCMRISGFAQKEAEEFVNGAMEAGANFFDHADIYGGGKSEEVFADAVHMNADVREKMVIQSKCGIKPGEYDFSKEHILKSVEGSLKRLKTEYLDVLLLHRPDALVEPEEVAETFAMLHESGKVRHFGVSNHTAMQMKLLQKYVKFPIVANQLQMSITNATLISQGMHMNTFSETAVDRDGGTLDFCRLEEITIQPWSPFQYGFFSGVFLNDEKFPALNQKIDEIAAKYEVSNTTIAMAWLLRHPANLQPVTGTTSIGRLKDCLKAAEIRLERKEWYEIFLAAGNTLP